MFKQHSARNIDECDQPHHFMKETEGLMDPIDDSSATISQNDSYQFETGIEPLELETSQIIRTMMFFRDVANKTEVKREIDQTIFERMRDPEVSAQMVDQEIVQLKQNIDTLLEEIEQKQVSINILTEFLSTSNNQLVVNATQLSDTARVLETKVAEIEQLLKELVIGETMVGALTKLRAQKKLSEHGFTSFEQVSEEISTLSKKIDSLYSQKFGRFRNRREIQEAKLQKKKLSDFHDTFFTEELRTTSDLKSNLAKQILDTCKSNIQNAGLEAGKHCIREDIERILLEDTMQGQEAMHVQHILKIVLPNLISVELERFCADHSYNEELNTWIASPENRNILIHLTYDTILDENSMGIADMNNTIPAVVREVIPVLVQKEYNDTLKDILEVLSNFPAFIKLTHMQQDITEFSDSLGDNFAKYKTQTQLGNLCEQIQNNEMYKKIQKLIKTLDIEHLHTLISHPKIKEIFGSERLLQIEEHIKQTIRDDLLQSKEHTPNSLELGFKMLQFHDSDVALLNIMNAIRESGLSGEHPFLRFDITSFSQTKLGKYINNLSSEQITELMHSSIPGVAQFLQLAQENPGNLHHYYRTYHDDERGNTKSHINPAFQKAYNCIAQMSIHFVNNGNSKEQRFAAETLGQVLKNIDISSEVEEELIQLLLHGDDPEVVIKIFSELIRANNVKARRILASHWDNCTPTMKEALGEIKIDLFNNVAKKDSVEDDEVRVIAEILSISLEECNNTFLLLKKLRELYTYIYYPTPETLERYISLAQNHAKQPSRIQDLVKYGYKFQIDHFAVLQEIFTYDEAIHNKLLSFVQDLSEVGYRFQIDHYTTLIKIMDNSEELIRDIRVIMEHIPDFEYSPLYEMDDEDKHNIITDPHRILGIKEDIDVIVRYVSTIDDGGPHLESLTRGLLEKIHRTNPAFLTIQDTNRFKPAIKELSLKFLAYSETEFERAEFLTNMQTLRFVAQYPERINEIIDIVNTCNDFFILIQPGGPLGSLKTVILESIFVKNQPLIRIKEIERIFSQKVPYSEMLFLFLKTHFDAEIEISDSQYPITDVAGKNIRELIEEHRIAKNENPNNSTVFDAAISDETIKAQLLSGDIQTIPFQAFSREYKNLILKEYLKHTIDVSRSKWHKSKADEYNRDLASRGKLVLRDGDWIHGSAVEHVDSILWNGNLAGECLGQNAGKDLYPFHVDVAKIREDYLRSFDGNNTEQTLTNSLAAKYGENGIQNIQGQIFYVYKNMSQRRTQGKEYYGLGEHHVLILGGIPSTDISGIVLRDKDTTLEYIKKVIVENGFYIPVFDITGELLFSPADYDKIVACENLKVEVETWDYSLKTGDQKGSNPGGEFTVPTDEGPKKFYVKFEKADTAHLWCEQLADNIYRHFEIHVPNTKVVKTEGRYGHASEILEIDQNVVIGQNDLNDGFIVDALLGNWDIPYARNRNVIRNNGNVYRIDNGGALLFHAKGERKGEELFGNIVHELEVGTNHERLGWGMRQEYIGLTEDAIIEQTKALQDKLTDDAIDILVDGVRLNEEDRIYLKQVLKARRDYIIAHIMNVEDV